MAKTILMGDGQLSEEEAKNSKEFTERHEQEIKEIGDAQIKKEQERQKVSLEELMLTKMEALEDRVIIWPDAAPDVIGNIIVPDEAKKQLQPKRGTVIKVGPGKLNDIGINNVLLLNLLQYGSDISDIKLAELKQKVNEYQSLVYVLKPGDRVMYGRYAGTPIEEPSTGEELLIMRPGDIFVKL